MSRPNPQQRTNGQFYRKLRLNREYMDIIKFFRKIRVSMKKDVEGVDIDAGEDEK